MEIVGSVREDVGLGVILNTIAKSRRKRKDGTHHCGTAGPTSCHQCTRSSSHHHSLLEELRVVPPAARCTSGFHVSASEVWRVWPG